MAKADLLKLLQDQTEDLKKHGLFKEEREIASPQQANIILADGRKVINLCSNNYLGLANHPDIIQAAKEGLDRYGFGLSSVRFICGTQTVHHELEAKLSRFLETDDTILYSSCWDANGGLFETVFGEQDAIISDALNHASIIDGVRLCKAKRFRYQNNDMQDLEVQLKNASGSRFKLIVTDGVFSMDGTIADLRTLCDLADRYDAFVMVDDSHAVGFIGEKGKGTPEFCNVMNRIDILTGTFGKALGGASGGYTSGKKEIIDWLRQRSRPYLFSNTLAPNIASATIKAIELISTDDVYRQRLQENTKFFREKLMGLGFNLIPGVHPIIPIMLGDAKLAQDFAAEMLVKGVYVIGFAYPVVPKEKARIRTQISASHTLEDLSRAVEAFHKVGKQFQVI